MRPTAPALRPIADLIPYTGNSRTHPEAQVEQIEARTLLRDQQGMRLGDRLAMTQVVDGYGAKDLALDVHALLERSAAQLGVSTGRRRRRAPARVDRAA